jgi:outer membrane immunogenic protein
MKSFKFLGLGLVSALALSAAAPMANAADIYQGSQKDTPPAGPINYAPPITWAGFYIGANLGAAWDDSDIEIVDDATLIGGGHLGYNWQGARNLVVGVEGDVDFLDNVDYLASIRGRLGWAFGPTLAYATGGAAFIGFDDGVSNDDSDTGWVAGLGVEHKLRDRVSVGVEGLYYAFEDDFNNDANFWAARARLTYHLGGY